MWLEVGVPMSWCLPDVAGGWCANVVMKGVNEHWRSQRRKSPPASETAGWLDHTISAAGQRTLILLVGYSLSVTDCTYYKKLQCRSYPASIHQSRIAAIQHSLEQRNQEHCQHAISPSIRDLPRIGGIKCNADGRWTRGLTPAVQINRSSLTSKKKKKPFQSAARIPSSPSPNSDLRRATTSCYAWRPARPSVPPINLANSSRYHVLLAF